MKIEEYADKVMEVLNQAKDDPEVSYYKMLSLITTLAEVCLNNIESMAGIMAPMIKEAIGVYRR